MKRSTRRQRAARAAAALLPVALLAGAAARVAAQAPVLLPPDHWAAVAARKLMAAGSLERQLDAGQRRIPLAEVARAFEEGSRVEDLSLRALAEAYGRRLERDFGGVARVSGAGVGGALGAAAIARDGEVGTRSGLLRPGPDKNFVVIEEQAGPIRTDGVRVEPAGFAAAAFGRFAASIEGRATPSGDAVLGAQGGVRLGPLAAWFGRVAPGYGPGRRGSLVLWGERALAGAGISSVKPVRLPWVFSVLGDVRFETFVGRLKRSREVDHPLLWGARFSAAPHARFGFGISRAAMFGGDQNGGFQLGHFLRILAVDRLSGPPFENQVGALDLWGRPPVGGLPLLLYVEWGSDDASGGLTQVPGIVAGVEVGAWPSLPALGATLEVSWLAPTCCGNGPWYWHPFFPAGWALDGRLLAHPLAGEGTEVALALDLDLSPAEVAGSVELAWRTRGEDNLLSPVRRGSSLEVRMRGLWRPTDLAEVVLSGYVEDADDWSRAGASVGARILF